MDKKRTTFAKRIASRILLWVLFFGLILSYIILQLEGVATRKFYLEIYKNKMHITKEYTRRVISDVYVAVTNNIYYLEHTLDKPDEHKETMKRIVESGTRVRSCGISFIKDYYYPQKQHRFCPFAWRNVAQNDIIWTADMGDADLDYLEADWFLSVIQSDSAQWSKPFYDGYDETTTLAAYMVPIHDSEGQVIAALGADISLDWLTGKLSEADSTVNMSTMFMGRLLEIKSKSFIIDHDGTFLTHADKTRILEDNFFDQIKPCDGSDVDQLVNSIKNGLDYENHDLEKFIINGEECYLYYTSIRYVNWCLISIIPAHSVDILGYINGATVIIIFLISILIIVFICYIYIRNGIEPLNHLNKVAEDMANGHFDTKIPDMQHNDEIAQLADSIEQMQYTLSNHTNQ